MPLDPPAERHRPTAEEEAMYRAFSNLSVHSFGSVTGMASEEEGGNWPERPEERDINGHPVGRAV